MLVYAMLLNFVHVTHRSRLLAVVSHNFYLFRELMPCMILVLDIIYVYSDVMLLY